MAVFLAFGGFTHAQTEPSSTWIIEHSLGRSPIVDVVVDYNGAQEVINPLSIKHYSTQVVITFSSPQTGFARLG